VSYGRPRPKMLSDYVLTDRWYAPLFFGWFAPPLGLLCLPWAGRQPCIDRCPRFTGCQRFTTWPRRADRQAQARWSSSQSVPAFGFIGRAATQTTSVSTSDVSTPTFLSPLLAEAPLRQLPVEVPALALRVETCAAG